MTHEVLSFLPRHTARKHLIFCPGSNYVSLHEQGETNAEGDDLLPNLKRIKGGQARKLPILQKTLPGVVNPFYCLRTG